MTCTVLVTGMQGGGAIAVRPSAYNKVVATAIYRTLPSARYNKQRTQWEMPATVGAVHRLHEALPELERAGAKVVAQNGIEIVPIVAPQATDAEIPFASRTPLWHHQRMAYWYLHNAREMTGAALLDCGMRTGKTTMVLSHLAGLAFSRRRALVVAPTSVVPVWKEQADERIGNGLLRVEALDRGSVSHRIGRAIELLSSGDPIVAVVGWSVLERMSIEQKRLMRHALSGAAIVADEVHYAKSPGSIRSLALHYIARGAEFRIGASGTPLSHSPMDAYAIFRYLDPGVWGTSFGRFRDEYATMGGFQNHQVTGYKNLEDMAKRMSPYVFRVTRDVLELPDAQHINVVVRLPDDAWRVYEELRTEAVTMLKSGVFAVDNALAKLMRLAQVASGHIPEAGDTGRVEIVHDEKQRALTDLLMSCDPSEPWVVFGRFHHDLDVASRAAAAAKRPCLEFSGRRKQLDEWRSLSRSGRGPVLATQIRSGGIGISLVEAAFCAYLSVGYSLDEWEQSIARIHGPEQTRPVAYYHIISRGTVDVSIRRALEKRADVLKYVSDEMMNAQRSEQ